MTRPDSVGSVVCISGAKTWLSTMVPSYFPAISTSFSCGAQSATYALFTLGLVIPAVRSNENLTSSVVSSP